MRRGRVSHINKWSLNTSMFISQWTPVRDPYYIYIYHCTGAADFHVMRLFWVRFFPYLFRQSLVPTVYLKSRKIEVFENFVQAMCVHFLQDHGERVKVRHRHCQRNCLCFQHWKLPFQCKSSTCKVSYHCNTQFLCFEFYMLTNVKLGLRLENILFCQFD